MEPRFNLLLLEDGELFFEDYAAILHMPGQNRKQLPGRLKVASKNLIFEPDSWQYPIFRFPYRDMCGLNMNQNKEHLIIMCSQVVQMKKHNVIDCYDFISFESPKTDGVFIVEPCYCKLDDFVGVIAKIYQINKLASVEHSREQLHMLITEREKHISFDSSWFVDINEITQLNIPLIVSKVLLFVFVLFCNQSINQ